MSNKLVSIIVPVYNTSSFLEKCVSSLLNQSYRDIEVILFDDGSKDNSYEICKSFAEKDDRVKVFTQQNQGVAQTRLNAFDVSSGAYITFVDSDDYVDKDYVKLLVEHLERENVDMVSSQHCNVHGEHITKVERKLQGRFDKEGIEEILKTNYLFDRRTNTTGITVYLCTKLVKRQFMRKALERGLGLWYGEDQVGVTQLMYDVDSMYVSQDYTYFYVMNSSQATQKYNPSLWQSQINCWKKMMEIDTKCLLSDQLSYRMMLNINNNLFSKLAPNLRSYATLKQDVLLFRDDETLKTLFLKKKINLTKKINLVFFLLKRRLYFLLYFLLRLKNL